MKEGGGSMRSIKKEDGQSALEFALILPILLIVVCGIIDFGWLLYNQLALSNTARESARYAVVNSSTTLGPGLITAKANSVAPDTIKPMTVTVTFSDTNTPVRGYVTVKITTRIKVLTPVLGIFSTNQQRTLVSKVTMKCECAPYETG